MKEMKTLTINGVTYTVTDPDAARIDDASIGNDASWSSKKIDFEISLAELSVVDKLCHSFTETGAIVVCEPVEGYPLDVTWRGKNLCPTATCKTRQDIRSAEITLDAPLPSGTYYFSALIETTDSGDKVVVAFYNTDGSTEKTLAHITKKEGERCGCQFTLSEPTSKFRLYAADSYQAAAGDEATFADIQIEKGTQATAYEPYVATATINRCGGKNLFDFTQGWSKVKFPGSSGGPYTRDGFAIILPAGTYTLHTEPKTSAPPVHHLDGWHMAGVVTKADGTYQETASLLSGHNLVLNKNNRQIQGFPSGSVVKNPSANARDKGDESSMPGWEDLLEEEMATHSSILAWRIPWTEEPGGL